MVDRNLSGEKKQMRFLALLQQYGVLISTGQIAPPPLEHQTLWETGPSSPAPTLHESIETFLKEQLLNPSVT